jgi:serine/threonine protein kinase
VLLWKRLNHPNILPFYGASMNWNQFGMVSPWMENGNVINYTRMNPEANRLRLVSFTKHAPAGNPTAIVLQLIDVASGLKFLHRVNLVHGNIRGVCIAVTAVNSNPSLKISLVKYPDKRQPASTSSPRGLRLEHNHIRSVFAHKGVHQLDRAGTFDP